MTVVGHVDDLMKEEEVVVVAASVYCLVHQEELEGGHRCREEQLVGVGAHSVLDDALVVGTLRVLLHLLQLVY